MPTPLTLPNIGCYDNNSSFLVFSRNRFPSSFRNIPLLLVPFQFFYWKCTINIKTSHDSCRFTPSFPHLTMCDTSLHHQWAFPPPPEASRMLWTTSVRALYIKQFLACVGTLRHTVSRGVTLCDLIISRVLVTQLDTTKASGPDRIPARLLKECSKKITPRLCCPLKTIGPFCYFHGTIRLIYDHIQHFVSQTEMVFFTN